MAESTNPQEGFSLGYECCGKDVPERWHERLIICPWALLLLAGAVTVVVVLAVVLGAI